MIWLTAWITALVSAMWIWFASILPTFLICAVGPILTFRILHIIWLKLSRMFNPDRDKWVEVFKYETDWKWDEPYIKFHYWQWNRSFYQDWWDVIYKETYDKKTWYSYSRKLAKWEKIPFWSYVEAIRDEKYKYRNKNYHLLEN